MRFLLIVLAILFMTLRAQAAEGKPDEADKGKLNDQAAEDMKKSAPPGKALQFPKGDGLRVLVVGNSWTWPAKKPLPEIAKAAGIKDQHVLVTGRGSGGGHAGPFFKDDTGKAAAVFQAIETGQWDVLTLISRAGCKDKPEHFTQWMDLCLKANPRMVFYIQQGWPRPMTSQETQDRSGAKVKAAAADPKALLARMESQLAKDQAEFKALFDAIEARHPGKLRMIPCGAAVVEMVRLYAEGKLPGYDCIMEYDYNGSVDQGTVNVHGLGARGIFSDNGHLSTAGNMSQLLAYMFYASLYGKSPELIKGYAPAGIDPAVDQLMRKAAWRAVTGDPLSGIADKDGDGLADDAKALGGK